MRRCKVSQEAIEVHKLKISTNPRGPRPQSCDVCQLRKVKCSKDQPSCASCARLGYACSYRRVGMRDNTIIQVDPKPLERPVDLLQLLRSLLGSSIINNQKSQVGFHFDGTCFYIGNSLGASFLAANAAMLSKSMDVKVPPAIVTQRPLGLAGGLEQQSEVIGLYFGYINTFFPVIHPPSFYYQMGRNESDDSFMALLSVICLCGSSFYPDRKISQRLGDMYAHHALVYLRRCYLRPSLNAIQACTLLAFQLNPVESDPIISNSWFYSGIARSMAISLGYHRQNPSLSQASRGVARRVLWLITINDILCSHITGRQSSVGANLLNCYPRIDSPCASVNLESYTSITIPELINIHSDDSLRFFRAICELCSLISQLDCFNKRSKMRINETRSKPSIGSQRSRFIKDLQEKALLCYSRLYPFVSGPRNPRRLQLPAANDLLLGVLSVYHFSFLIDLNRPDILPSHNLDENRCILLMKRDSVDMSAFLKCNPLERCQIAARLAFRVICISQGKLAEFCTPTFWYAVLQICFTSLLVLDRSGKHPWAIASTKSTLRFLRSLLVQSASRRAIVHDCLLMIQPFLEKYLDSPSLSREPSSSTTT
ncbi:hypothetical protein DSO57_1010252 [Entomophthora muscae]|uniref:Uncharacterized protein n=1 Tax=Entomophthora muscae TaxID=34485 RepID=A0ACC2TUQ6_9FUNG|nr:hypothetical protein DSO57_1010252 [Entomophthora muscae]